MGNSIYYFVAPVFGSIAFGIMLFEKQIPYAFAIVIALVSIGSYITQKQESSYREVLFKYPIFRYFGYVLVLVGILLLGYRDSFEWLSSHAYGTCITFGALLVCGSMEPKEKRDKWF